MAPREERHESVRLGEGFFLKDGTDEYFRVDREESGQRESPKVQKRRNNG